MCLSVLFCRELRGRSFAALEVALFASLLVIIRGERWTSVFTMYTLSGFTDVLPALLRFKRSPIPSKKNIAPASVPLLPLPTVDSCVASCRDSRLELFAALPLTFET